MEKTKQRSLRQNRSNHKRWTDIADALNAAGYDQRMVLQLTAYDIPNTMESVKSMARRFGKLMFDKDSTADWTSKESVQVDEVLTRELCEKLKLDLPPYPSEEALEMERNGWERKK